MHDPGYGAPNAQFRFSPGQRLLTAASAASPDTYQSGGGGPVIVPPASPETAPGYRRLASLGDRFLASVLDILMGAATSIVIGMWSAVMWGGVTPTGFFVQGKPEWIAVSVILLVGFLYYWLLEGLAGATLGKAIAGIQVRQADGGKCGLRPALLRNLLRIVDAIPLYLVGFLVAVFSKRRQRLGDHVAGTVVVELPIGRRVRAAFFLLWIAFISGSIVGAWMIHRGAPVTPIQMKLVSFVWTESLEGPPRATNIYKPGDVIFASYTLADFGADSQGQVDLTVMVTIMDPAGLPLNKPLTQNIRKAMPNILKVMPDVDVAFNGKFFLPLPGFIPGGMYKVLIKTHDAIKNSDDEFAQTFTVVPGPAISPANQLEIRNFQFSTSAGGPPLSPAVYQPGQTVHYSYQLFGIRFLKDRVDLHIAYNVIGPDGQTLLGRPASMDKTFVYHPDNFFLPAQGHFNMPSGAKKGTYIVRLVITDKVAGKTLNSEGSFEVR
jgi:uncharacterized RDD family membrane protein YckC